MIRLHVSQQQWLQHRRRARAVYPSRRGNQPPANDQSPTITKNLTAKSPVTARTPLGSIHPCRRATSQPIAGRSQSRSRHNRFIKSVFFRRIGAAVAPTTLPTRIVPPTRWANSQPITAVKYQFHRSTTNRCSLSSAHDPSKSSRPAASRSSSQQIANRQSNHDRPTLNDHNRGGSYVRIIPLIPLNRY